MPMPSSETRWDQRPTSLRALARTEFTVHCGSSFEMMRSTRRITLRIELNLSSRTNSAVLSVVRFVRTKHFSLGTTRASVTDKEKRRGARFHHLPNGRATSDNYASVGSIVTEFVRTVILRGNRFTSCTTCLFLFPRVIHRLQFLTIA